jgi:hypothetical protein
LAPWKPKSGEAERGSGIGLKLFGFIPDSVFTFIPDHCSESSGLAFGIIPESRSRSSGIPSPSYYVRSRPPALIPLT